MEFDKKILTYIQILKKLDEIELQAQKAELAFPYERLKFFKNTIISDVGFTFENALRKDYTNV